MSDCTCHERTAGICDVCREGSFGRYLRESLNRRCAECDRLEAELRLREEEIERLNAERRRDALDGQAALDEANNRAEAAERERGEWRQKCIEAHEWEANFAAQFPCNPMDDEPPRDIAERGVDELKKRVSELEDERDAIKSILDTLEFLAVDSIRSTREEER